MRVERRRTKKLIVAFHFHASGGPARWKCDECRRQGLESARRCGLRSVKAVEGPRAVWVRGGLAIQECPRSYVSAESIGWLELYTAWRKATDVREMAAKDVEAMLMLEREIEANRGNE